MLTVNDLVAEPGLGLQLVAGSENADREIVATAVSELARPGPWMQGGELLLLIGLLLPKDEAGCTAYVRHLLDHDVRAVGLGLGADLPQQSGYPPLTAACAELGMPLLLVPDGVPFIAVTKAFFAHRAREEHRRLAWTLRTQRTLTAAAVTPGGLRGILAAYRRATGHSGLVLDPLGRTLAGSDPEAEQLGERLRGLLGQLQAGRRGLGTAATQIVGGRREEAHPLGARRTRAWLLLETDAEAPGQLSASLVSLLSLELERQYALDAGQRAGRAQLLQRLSRASVPDDVAARWLAGVGVPAGQLQAGVVAAGADAQEVASELLFALPDALVHADGEHVEVVVPAGTGLASALLQLAAGLPAGLGSQTRCGATALSLRQAWSAVPASKLRGRHVHAREIANVQWLLDGLPTETREGYADAVLGGVEGDDRGRELVATLEAYLERNGHRESAAATLGVHRHTVRNRIERIERLTGRRLDSAQDRHELWLALRARDAT